MNDIEKVAKRKLYRGQIKILEGYRTNMKQAINKFGEGNQIYRSSDSWYSPQWQGGTKVEYDKMSSELKGLGKGIYSIGDELVGAINKEIRRLRGQVEDLR